MTFDNLVRGWKYALKFGPFEHGDFLNKADVDLAFKLHSPVAVMHFAALSQVGESMQEVGLYRQNNFMGSLNLIQAAMVHGCMDFVFRLSVPLTVTKTACWWANIVCSRRKLF